MTGGETHDPQLLKGLVTLLIMAVLRRGESYGYEIASQLRQYGLIDLKDGTVYPALGRLEKDKLVSTRLAESAAGPARKYYSLTRRGVDELKRTHDQWLTLVETVDRAFDDGR